MTFCRTILDSLCCDLVIRLIKPTRPGLFQFKNKFVHLHLFAGHGFSFKSTPGVMKITQAW